MEQNQTLDKPQTSWQEINPGQWKPQEPGDSIEGVLVSKTPGNEYINTRYHLDVKKEGITTVWGSAVLDSRMRFVSVGQLVKIVFEGKGENKQGQPLNLFKVFSAKD